MKHNEFNFKDCLFDPKVDRFLTDVQSIREFEQYSGGLPKKKLFTWIVIMFDLESPLRKTVTNYYERKKLAADIAGWNTRSNGEFEEDVTKLLLGNDEKANVLIVAYLVMFSMPEYLQLIAYLNMSYAITREVMTNQFDANSAKTLDYITDRIKTLTRDIYGSGQNDEVMLARKALYETAEKERIKLNPENIVKIMVEEGGLPDSFNPYEGHKNTKIKFKGDAN